MLLRNRQEHFSLADLRHMLNLGARQFLVTLARESVYFLPHGSCFFFPLARPREMSMTSSDIGAVAVSTSQGFLTSSCMDSFGSLIKPKHPSQNNIFKFIR